jgi:nicotinamide phosphoribosyltransferase
MKQTIAAFLRETGSPDQLPFKLHDFGFRGVSSVETAALGGAAHLVNFLGTDNFAGIVHARQYYGADMPGFSIPAAEHSTITAWGRDHETDAYRNMLQQFPTGLVAVVSDSYDVFNACREIWGNVLKAEILARDGTLVIRPDSGDPPTVVVQVLNILGERFGCSTNEKGYRVLDPHVRIIQGDGIDREMLPRILEAVRAAHWSADNIAFGSGGGLLQKLNRDTCRYAFKCSSATINGIQRDVYKQPATDSAKQSKRGRLKLVHRDGQLLTVPESEHSGPDLLHDVFLNGELLNRQTWADICHRAAAGV